MNGQYLTKIDVLEKELKELKKALQKKTMKPTQSLATMKSLWKKLKVSDEELDEAKRAVFDFGK